MRGETPRDRCAPTRTTRDRREAALSQTQGYRRTASRGAPHKPQGCTASRGAPRAVEALVHRRRGLCRRRACRGRRRRRATTAAAASDSTPRDDGPPRDHGACRDAAGPQPRGAAAGLPPREYRRRDAAAARRASWSGHERREIAAAETVPALLQWVKDGDAALVRAVAKVALDQVVLGFGRDPNCPCGGWKTSVFYHALKDMDHPLLKEWPDGGCEHRGNDPSCEPLAALRRGGVADAVLACAARTDAGLAVADLYVAYSTGGVEHSTGRTTPVSCGVRASRGRCPRSDRWRTVAGTWRRSRRASYTTARTETSRRWCGGRRSQPAARRRRARWRRSRRSSSRPFETRAEAAATRRGRSFR